MSNLYEQDFYQWTIEQASLLRAGALSQLDIGNLIEEVESMGKSQKLAVESRLTALIIQMKQPGDRPGVMSKIFRLGAPGWNHAFFIIFPS